MASSEEDRPSSALWFLRRRPCKSSARATRVSCRAATLVQGFAATALCGFGATGSTDRRSLDALCLPSRAPCVWTRSLRSGASVCLPLESIMGLLLRRRILRLCTAGAGGPEVPQR
eukprot:Amastigsp_a847030_6.p6 type:complete len:116 gc:universal Amastigsp_a847030_6:1542-1195(-)